MHGWLNIDKPKGISSAQAVGLVKRLLKVKELGIKKIGHAGTLDPFATGVLPLAIGEATKTVAFVQDAGKEYLFVLQFGSETDTGDSTGTIIRTSDVVPSTDQIRSALGQFIGKIQQIPPVYSAIKVAGKRSYDLARAGKAVELAAREIEIEALTLESFEPTTASATLRVRCGKGTYVRTLGCDLAANLSACGHVRELCRTEVGVFDESNIISVARLEEMIYTGSIKDYILPIQKVLKHIPAFDCSAEQKSKILQGREIKLENECFDRVNGSQIVLGQNFNTADTLRLKNNVLVKSDETPVAIGIIDGYYFRPVRVFNL